MKAIIIIISIMSSSCLFGSGWVNAWPDNNKAGSPKNVKFLNDYGIMLADLNVVLITTDKGETWEYIEYLPGEEVAFSEVSIVNESTSYAVGWRGYIIKTTDSGKNWNKLASPFVEYYTRVDFVDENNGWVSSFNKFIKTSDGGLSWMDVEQPLKTIYDQHFIDKNTGYICGESNSGIGEIYLTKNGGTSWELYYSQPSQLIIELYFLGNSIYAAGSLGGIFVNKNNSDNWISLNSSLNDYITSIYFINDNVGWVSTWSTGGVYSTLDGGDNWDLTYTSEENSNKIFDIHFFDEKNGFAIGNNQILLKTETGGLNETSVEFKFTTGLIDVYPNPSFNTILISNLYILPLNYSISNLDGKVIIDGILDTNQDLDLTNKLSNGIYFIKVQSENRFETRKIIVTN